MADILRDRFRSKTDLHDYMSNQCKYNIQFDFSPSYFQFTGRCWLPQSRYTRLRFLQQILAEHKMVLQIEQIPTNAIKKHWYEYAVCNVLHLVQEDEELMKYFPDELLDGKFPDRRFFWGILFALRPEWAE